MLRTFVTVAECKNLADAAARLGRTVSAVSMMLKQLEEHLGKPLFETDRKNRLSHVGTFVLAQAQGQLLQFDQTVQAIETYAQAGTGMVRIAAVPSVAGTLLPRVFLAFARAHPDVQIDLRDMDSANVLKALEEERADIGIASFPNETSDFQRSLLFTDPIGLICHCDHHLAFASTPLPWSALRGEVLIANELCRVIGDPDFQVFYDNARISVHNTLSLLAMVKAGLGITILPYMAQALADDGLVFRPIGKGDSRRHIELLHKPRDRISPATTVLVNLIKQVAQELDATDIPTKDLDPSHQLTGPNHR